MKLGAPGGAATCTSWEHLGSRSLQVIRLNGLALEEWSNTR